jgi:hypothetical protein
MPSGPDALPKCIWSRAVSTAPTVTGGMPAAPECKAGTALHVLGSASLLFSSCGLQDSILSRRRGGGGRRNYSKVRICTIAPGSEVREPSGNRSTARPCFAVDFNERDSKRLCVSLLSSQAARACWADATEVLFVMAAQFACWTSNSALASALPVSNRAASADSRSSLAACSEGE